MCRRLLIQCRQNFINLHGKVKSVTTANAASQFGCYFGLITTLYVACNASADTLCLSGLILETSPPINMSSWTSFIDANHLMKLAPDSLRRSKPRSIHFIINASWSFFTREKQDGRFSTSSSHDNLLCWKDRKLKNIFYLQMQTWWCRLQAQRSSFCSFDTLLLTQCQNNANCVCHCRETLAVQATDRLIWCLDNSGF